MLDRRVESAAGKLKDQSTGLKPIYPELLMPVLLLPVLVCLHAVKTVFLSGSIVDAGDQDSVSGVGKHAKMDGTGKSVKRMAASSDHSGLEA